MSPRHWGRRQTRQRTERDVLAWAAARPSAPHVLPGARRRGPEARLHHRQREAAEAPKECQRAPGSGPTRVARWRPQVAAGARSRSGQRQSRPETAASSAPARQALERFIMPLPKAPCPSVTFAQNDGFDRRTLAVHDLDQSVIAVAFRLLFPGTPGFAFLRFLTKPF